MLNFDAFDLVKELPPGKHACDVVWVDEWRGHRVRSRLCVRQFKAEGLRGWTILEESTGCLAGFPFHDPWPEELLCYTDAD